MKGHAEEAAGEILREASHLTPFGLGDDPFQIRPSYVIKPLNLFWNIRTVIDHLEPMHWYESP